MLAQGEPTAGGREGVTGSSVNWICAVARRSREGYPDALGDRRHANPGAAPLLTATQAPQAATTEDIMIIRSSYYSVGSAGTGPTPPEGGSADRSRA